MEAIGLGLQALGSAVGAWATAFGFIYVVGILSKTFLKEKTKILKIGLICLVVNGAYNGTRFLFFPELREMNVMSFRNPKLKKGFKIVVPRTKQITHRKKFFSRNTPPYK